MRKSPFSLQIPQPCAESWEGMTPRGAGRHCASCQQVVIDFTQKTDAEVLALVRQAVGGRACGRFRAGQLERPLRPLGVSTRGNWWSAAVAATVALLLGRALAGPEARAQSPHPRHPGLGQHAPEPELSRRPASPETPPRHPNQPAAGPGVITGQVVDQRSGEGLPGVTVRLKNTDKGTSTDAQGYFTIPVGGAERGIPLLFSSVGYVTEERVQPGSTQRLLVTLEGDVKGGLVNYPIYTPRGAWGYLRGLPYRIATPFR